MDSILYHIVPDMISLLSKWRSSSVSSWKQFGWSLESLTFVAKKAHRCRVHLDIRRKRPRCWFTTTFFGKDYRSVIIVFSSISLWLYWTVVLHPSCVTELRVVRILDFCFGACEIRTFLTTSRFADSNRVAIALRATGCVSLYVKLSVT